MIDQAFILGAGLGTRLRPLTNHLPKPLVPLFHSSLAVRAMDACAAAGIKRFAINTHHLHEAWITASEPRPDTVMQGGNGIPAEHRTLGGHAVSLFHEPDLLDTGGGLSNIHEWCRSKPLLVHNGDIFTTLPLLELIAAHESSRWPVTLALRSGGPAPHIAFDARSHTVTDIRNKLGHAEGSHTFSGVYCVDPDFLASIPPHEVISVIPSFLELAAAGGLGAVVLDDGVWLDLGDRASYLAAHQSLNLPSPIHPDAELSPTARIEQCVISAGSVIGDHASLRNCVIWPAQQIAPYATLESCIVCSGRPVSGRHHNEDL
jgi:NDP-sugar pyrophosphorylase family protein